MITASKVSKNYGRKSVLTEIDLELSQGELIAFIGPNGAGKSTLLSVISRLQPEFAGELYLDQTEIKAWQSTELAKRLAILKQTNHLQVQITVKELVAFGRFPYSRGRLTRKDHQIIENALIELQLIELADAKISSLSGGQLQRVYIALVLAQDTDYILLDEPLNNLDLNHANQIMHLLKRLVTELRKTILIVIHDINFAAGFADRIIALKDGAIFKNGPTNEVIQPQVLNELYQMDVKVCQIEGKRFCLYFD